MTNYDTYEVCAVCEDAEAVTLTERGLYVCGACEFLSPQQARRLSEKLADR